MAYIRPRKRGGYFVRWRTGGRAGPVHSQACATLEEAEAFKAAKEAELATYSFLTSAPGIPGWESGAPVAAADEAYSVAGYLAGIIARDRSLRQSSLDTYGATIRNHIAPSPLGHMDIRHVGAPDLVEFWSGSSAGPGTLRSIRELLSKAFRTAVAEEVIDVNPLARAGIKAPGKGRKAEVIPLTAEEIERLADGAETERDRAMILVMGYGGLRGGEVGGLRDQDVDWARARVHVRQAVSQTKSGKTLGQPKTRAALRTVPLPRSVVDELKPLVPADDGRLFYGRKPADLVGHIAINHAVQRAAKRAGMRRVNAHLLRHSAVSLLIDAGANPRAVQTFVGHSDIGMTLGVYGHLFDYGGQALADAMEARRAAGRGIATP